MKADIFSVYSGYVALLDLPVSPSYISSLGVRCLAKLKIEAIQPSASDLTDLLEKKLQMDTCFTYQKFL